jgi:hypothetical protein
MSKTFYVSSGEVRREVQATTALEAAKIAILEALGGTRFGLIIEVSDKGFTGDRNPWYVSTQVVVETVGHKWEDWR